MEAVPVPIDVRQIADPIGSELLYLERTICGTCLRQMTCSEEYRPCAASRNAFTYKNLILVRKEANEQIQDTEADS